MFEIEMMLNYEQICYAQYFSGLHCLQLKIFNGTLPSVRISAKDCLHLQNMVYCSKKSAEHGTLFLNSENYFYVKEQYKMQDSPSQNSPHLLQHSDVFCTPNSYCNPQSHYLLVL